MLSINDTALIWSIYSALHLTFVSEQKSDVSRALRSMRQSPQTKDVVKSRNARAVSLPEIALRASNYKG